MKKNTPHCSSFRIEPFFALFSLTLLLCFVLRTTGETLRDPQYYMGLAAVLLLIFTLRRRLKFSAVSLIMGFGILTKLSYVLYTAVWNRQHDVVDFGVGEGQAAYIEYFLTHRSLPDFDPRSIWGFFQPPLHHIIAAIWMRISLYLGLSERQAQENVQGLTFFYMCAVMIFTCFICRELEMKKRGTVIALAIVCLHPIFTLFSGSINNDALSLLLMCVAFYLAIVWYKRPKWLTILLLALAVGCSMLAKLSAGLLAPAIAVLFLMKLLREKELRARLLLQYVLFGLVCVPIGLSWTIRNKRLYDMPLNYIPRVGGQFSELPFAARFFDFRMESVFPAMKEYGNTFYEHNIFLAMMKTSLFGEYHFGQQMRVLTPVGIVLFVSATLLALGALAATAFLLFSAESNLKTEWKWFFGVTYAGVMAGYLGFALGYSNFSAQDFRYAALVIIVEALCLGITADGWRAEVRAERIFLLLTEGVAAIFGVCSVLLYLLLGFA